MVSKTLEIIGPCQFPTLGFVVDRYLKIQNFVAEKFWFIHLELQKNNIITGFNWQRGKLFDHISCLIFYDQCASKIAKIISVVSKPTSKM